jgi:glutamate N-acetyltransferase/amino-acid N-acetyltransferase
MTERAGASRFVTMPAGVADAVGLPAGFRAAGIASGVKGGGELDLGVVVSDAPATVSAARFCDSGVLAAPVVVTKERCDLSGLRAVVANSGNANAATGEAGIAEAVRVQEAAAAALGLQPSQVAVASTGVIGVLLPGERIAAGIPRLVGALQTEATTFANAIKTTDALDKEAGLRVTLPSGNVTLSAQAKGAGMISPRFATMLCFIETDAALHAGCARKLLAGAVGRSFERVSVDGQLSTNDTVILIANGASGVVVEHDSEDEARFGLVLDAALRTLAVRMVADGEGARRIGRVVVRGGDPQDAERVARAVANSPLVKAALHGGDPNWGRVAQAIGAALPGSAPLAFDIAIAGIAVARDGAAVAHDAEALVAAVAGDEVEYEIALPGAGAEAEVLFSDLGHGYVRINAEYTT